MPNTRRAAEQLGLSREQVAECVGRLVDLRLLQRAPESGQLVPNSPEVAATMLLATEEADLLRRRSDLDGLRGQLLSLAPDYYQSDLASSSGTGLKVLRGADDTYSYLHGLLSECENEVFAIQPGGARDPRMLAEKLPRDLKLLERGVQLFLLYHHTVRADLTTRTHLGKLIRAGAQVRTTDQLTEYILLFDRRCAFLMTSPEENSQPEAIVVTEPTLVNFIYRTSEQAWATAQQVLADVTGYRGVKDSVKLTILRLLAEGATDEMVSRRLGIALRTCRRYVAELMGELQATSRFQAGVLAAQAGLFEVPEVNSLTLETAGCEQSG